MKAPGSVRQLARSFGTLIVQEVASRHGKNGQAVSKAFGRGGLFVLPRVAEVKGVPGQQSRELCTTRKLLESSRDDEKLYDNVVNILRENRMKIIGQIA